VNPLKTLTYYFAYGVDMDTDELDLQLDRRRRPRLRFARTTRASLAGYRLICDIASRTHHGGVFNIVPDPTSTVHGVVYELHPGDTITVGAIKLGETAHYVLSLLPVTMRTGDVVTALVLHANPEKKQLAASQTYLDIVLRAARAHGLPASWLQHLKSLQTA
jgi:cation transport regulator ChaC